MAEQKKFDRKQAFLFWFLLTCLSVAAIVGATTILVELSEGNGDNTVGAVFGFGIFIFMPFRLLLDEKTKMTTSTISEDTRNAIIKIGGWFTGLVVGMIFLVWILQFLDENMSVILGGILLVLEWLYAVLSSIVSFVFSVQGLLIIIVITLIGIYTKLRDKD